ncbi:MAG TPA: MerR family transcriptional regulator [Gammaproteobacteria bacterium]|nr:MerR family transcriptional regulator [Gammaproteobacteria bacterium]
MAEQHKTGMTIEELSARSGVTTRNIRAMQSRGLLPSPHMVRRTGYYDEGHLARLRLITGLQKRGFSLASIGELLQAWEAGRSLNDILGFESALTARWREKERVFTREQLQELMGKVRIEESDLDLAEELGVLAREGRDRYRVRYPNVVAVGAEAVRQGVPLQVGLREAARVLDDAERIASRFVTLFVDQFWRPFVERGMTSEEMPEVTRALERFQQIGLDIVQVATEEKLEEAIQETATKYFTPAEQRR